MFKNTLLLTALIATLGFGASAADCQRKTNLSITSAGAAQDASGTLDVRARGNVQRLKVSIDARVADGFTYLVSVNGATVGTITIQLGSGELELSNKDGRVLPAGTDPVCSVTNLSVSVPNGMPILTGRF